MRKISLLAAGLSVLAIAACSDATRDMTAPAPADLQISAIRNPTPTNNPNGPVWVLGDFNLEISFTGSGAGVNAHPQGKGYCAQQDGTVSGTTANNIYWFNDNNQLTGAPFCAGTGGGTTGRLNCTVDATSLPATYAFATGGQGVPATFQTSKNENINFHSDLIPPDSEQFVHYQTSKKATGNTTGKDLTAFSFTCTDNTTGDAYIDLSGFNATGANLFFGGNGTTTGDRQLDVTGGIDVVMFASGEGPFSGNDPADTPIGTGTLDDLYWFFRSRN